MSVTNEDLRNDLTRLTEQVRNLTNAVRGLTDAGKDTQVERRADSTKLTALYAGLSVLRWATGLVAIWVGGACVWTFNNLTEAINTNREQTLRLTAIEQEDKVRDTRLQNLERSQFASTVGKER